VVVADEVYEHIVFDGAPRERGPLPELADRVIVSSFGKTYHVTGWKVGYVLAPRELMAEFRKVHQFNVFGGRSWPGRLHGTMPRATSAGGVLPAKRAGAWRPPASRRCPAPARISRPSATRPSRISDTAFVDWLTREVGVAAIPLSAFFGDGRDG
jgi:methionine aminotransferase